MRRRRSIFAHLSGGMTDRDAKIWVNLCQNAGWNAAAAAPIDGVCLGNMRVAYRVDGWWIR